MRGLRVLSHHRLACSEHAIVKREYSNGCFSSVAYYASKTVFLSLTRGGQSLLIAVLIYFVRARRRW